MTRSSLPPFAFPLIAKRSFIKTDVGAEKAKLKKTQLIEKHVAAAGLVQINEPLGWHAKHPVLAQKDVGIRRSQA